MTEETKNSNPGALNQHPQHHRERFWLLAAAVVVIGGMLAIGILPRIANNKALAQGQAEAKNSVPEVVVVRPKLVADTGVSLPGNIEAIRETTVNARTTGYLRKLNVDIGSHVKKGDVLAVLEAPDVDQETEQAIAQRLQAQQVVHESDASVSSARANVAAARADAAKQRATIEQAQAQLASAQAAVLQATAVQEGAEANLEHMQEQLKVQQANLKTQQAQVTLAQATYDRYKELVKQGYDTLQDLDQAEATLKTNQAAVASAEASISSAESDIRSAQKSVQAAKEAVNSAQANVVANEKNVSLNRAALESSEATVKYNQEIVKVNQATVSANQAAVKAGLANENHYRVLQHFQQVLAPFDGVITARGVDVGTLLVGDTGSTSNSAATATLNNSSITTSGSGIVGIARTDMVRIQVSVPQSFVPAMTTGGKAAVTIRELPRRTFTGIVSRISGALDSVSRTQLVEVDLPNPDGVLVPGMYAQVQISPAIPSKTLRIPGTALIVDSNGVRVGIVKADNTVHMQKVVIGRDFGTTVEILKGLKGKERLVNNPSDLLQDGDKVQITQAAKKPGAKGGAGAGGGDAAAPGKRGAADDSDTGAAGGKTAGMAGKPDSGDDTGAGAEEGTGAGPGAGGHRHKGAGATGGSLGNANDSEAGNGSGGNAGTTKDADSSSGTGMSRAAPNAPTTGNAPNGTPGGGHHRHKNTDSGAGAGQ